MYNFRAYLLRNATNTRLNSFMKKHVSFHFFTYFCRLVKFTYRRKSVFGILYNNCDHLNTVNTRLNVIFTARNRIIITHATCHSWYFTWYDLGPKVLHACRTPFLSQILGLIWNVQLLCHAEIHTLFGIHNLLHKLQSKSYTNLHANHLLNHVSHVSHQILIVNFYMRHKIRVPHNYMHVSSYVVSNLTHMFHTNYTFAHSAWNIYTVYNLNLSHFCTKTIY